MVLALGVVTICFWCFVLILVVGVIVWIFWQLRAAHHLEFLLWFPNWVSITATIKHQELWLCVWFTLTLGWFSNWSWLFVGMWLIARFYKIFINFDTVLNGFKFVINWLAFLFGVLVVILALGFLFFDCLVWIGSVLRILILLWVFFFILELPRLIRIRVCASNQIDWMLRLRILLTDLVRW